MRRKELAFMVLPFRKVVLQSRLPNRTVIPSLRHGEPVTDRTGAEMNARQGGPGTA